MGNHSALFTFVFGFLTTDIFSLVGMVFRYMNEDPVWEAFCGTYEAIHKLLGRWDDWWVKNGSGVTIPSLQDEWREYIESVLTSLVNRSKASFDFHFTLAMMYVHPIPWSSIVNSASANNDSIRRIPPTPANLATYTTHWINNRLQNKQLIQITGECPNLGKIDP